MAAMTETQLPDERFVEHKLHKAWRKERRFHHTRGLCHFLLWLIALVLLDFAVDWLFLVPGYGRLALLAVNVGALGWVAYRHWFRYLRHYDPVRTALQVEGRHPELQSLLVSFVQFREGPREGSHVSPSLLRALRRQTIEYTQPLDFREIVSYRELKRIFLLSAVVLLFFAAISVNWGSYLRVLAYRMLNPESHRGYPTRTHILNISGNITVQQGKKATVQLKAGGLLPREGILYVRPQSGAWESVALPMADPGNYAYEFQEVYQSFRYRVRLGDVASQEFDVNVVPPPRIVETRVHLDFPAYTDMKPQTMDILNLEVPDGTKIRWELRCDRALASAALTREKADPAPLKLEQDGLLASFEATATESFDYSFQWRERQYGYEYTDEVRYFVQVIPDSAPQAEILRPLEDEKATVRKTLTIAYQARDDYGLAEAAIVYNVNDGEEQRKPLAKLKGRTVETEAAWAIKDSLPSLKEGDTITYAIEVSDNHSGEGGAFHTRSQARRLYLVSVEEYLRYLAEQRRKLVGEIRTMHTQETEAGEKVDEIKTKKPE